MCGRYEFILSDSKKALQIKNRAERFHLVYSEGEIYPTNNILCLIPKNDKVELHTFKWGIYTDKLQINARKESLNNYFYRNMINNTAAIICNGFYEWDQDKNKYYIHTDEELMYLAGIYNDKDEILIITKEAGDNFKHIHNRIPIIMKQNEMLLYLMNKQIDFDDKELIIKKVSQV